MKQIYCILFFFIFCSQLNAVLLKAKQSSLVPSTFNNTSLSLVYFMPNSVDWREYIRASINCPAGTGALRGFAIKLNPSLLRSTYGYDFFNYIFECTKGADDFTDRGFPTIAGTETRNSNVDVCKTDGTQGHIQLPVGNTCSCPDGFIMKNLRFLAVTGAKNYVGLSCTCARVLPSVVLKCESKQTLRMSTDNVNGKPSFTLFNYMTSTPVITNNIASLKSVTFSVTNKTDNISPSYTANGVWFDYTFCYNAAATPASTAPKNIDIGGVTDMDIWQIIYYHNNYRSKLATQKTTFTTQLPFAKNIRQVYWSSEIAAKAQEWANNCKFEHSNSTFRKTKNYPSLGENLAIAYGVSSVPKNWARAVSDWNSEITDYVKMTPNVESFQDSTVAVIAHFTQVVWAETYLIGCGYSVYIENGMTKNLYVCQYNPAGNMLTAPVYLKATSATNQACPAGTSASSTDFPGLCCLTDQCTMNTYIFS